MGREEQLAEFEQRRWEWNHYGLDTEYFSSLSDLCSLPRSDDPTALTVTNALRAAITERVDKYFGFSKSLEDGLDDKPSLHRNRLEEVRETAEKLQQLISELPDKTARKIDFVLSEPVDPEGRCEVLADVCNAKQIDNFNDYLEAAQRASKVADFNDLLDVPGFLDNLEEKYPETAHHYRRNRRDWLGRLIQGCERGLENLEEDPTTTKNAEQTLARYATEIFNMYSAYGWPDQSRLETSDGDDWRQHWADSFKQRRVEFVQKVLAFVGNNVSEKTVADRIRDRFIPRDTSTPETEVIPNLYYLITWPQNEQTPDTKRVRQIRERLLASMERLSEAAPFDSPTAPGGTVFSAYSHTLRLDHPFLETPGDIE